MNVENVITIQGDLVAVCEHLYKLILVGKVIVFHRIEQLHCLRVQEKLSACRRKNNI